MGERISIYEFRTGHIYHHIIHNLECWEYDGKEQVINRLLNQRKLDEEEIVLCQCGDRYYVKEGKNLFFSLKGFMSGIFKYNGKTFEDMYYVDNLSEILKNTNIKIQINDGDENELTQIINAEKKIYENILYNKMLSVKDNIKDPNMIWCVYETIHTEGKGLSMRVIKECKSKLEAWQYAKENEEEVKVNTDIIIHKIGLVKKIGDKYELTESGSVKIYQGIDVMREK